MGRMDRVCSMCQAGAEHTHDDDPMRGVHPDDRRVCADCGEQYNARSAALGSDVCPRCERRRRGDR